MALTLNHAELATIAGVQPVSNQVRTLAIVGSHPWGLNLVPWDDPTVEIMLFNEAPLKPEKYPRWDSCLQIHGPEVYAQDNNWVNPDYWPWLQQPHGKPIWMQEVDPRVPDSVKYPLDEILAMIPYRYLRSSPAMALALGIYLGYDRIELYGSELSSNTEYAYQATNYAFWIGFAHGRGIDVQLKCWLNEFYQEIYGYEGELQLSREYFTERLAEHESINATNSAAYEKAQRKLEDALFCNEIQQVADLIETVEGVAQKAGEALGCLEEARYYMERENMISRQEFERRSAQAQIDGDKKRTEKDRAAGVAEYLWNVWRMTGQLKARDQLRVFLGKQIDLAHEVGKLYGVYRENLNYMTEYDARLQAAGGKRALGRPQ